MPNVSPSPKPARLATPFRKVALFGGVYNNRIALSQAVRVAKERGAEALFCLGDLGGFGPSPDKVFPLIERHGIHCLQGNYEESLVSGLDDCGCGYTHPKDNHFAQISYDYTKKKLSPAYIETMAGFAKQMEIRVGTKTLRLCHGSPRRTNEFLWESTTSNGFLRRASEELACDVICCTHSGLHWKREFAPGKWIVNVGVLGRPANDGTTRVWFAEVSARPGGVDVELVPLEYDHLALSAEMRDENLPKEFVETIETGWWTTCLEILPGKERSRGKY